MIYIVNGFPGSGKTTFEEMVCKIVGVGHGYIMSTVDFVKEIAFNSGWDGTKTPRNRKFLSDLKDLLTEWNDVPFNHICKKVDMIKYDCTWVKDWNRIAIFIDCREPKEIAKLKSHFNAKTILIQRENNPMHSFSNHADSEVNKMDYDIIIKNDENLFNLANVAVDFVEQENLYFNQNITIDLEGNIK